MRLPFCIFFIDTEILKMDIQEERNVENTIKEMNRKKEQSKVQIEEIETFNIDKLTLIEKQEFSNKYIFILNIIILYSF